MQAQSLQGILHAVNHRMAFHFCAFMQCQLSCFPSFSSLSVYLYLQLFFIVRSPFKAIKRTKSTFKFSVKKDIFPRLKEKVYNLLLFSYYIYS